MPCSSRELVLAEDAMTLWLGDTLRFRSRGESLSQRTPDVSSISIMSTSNSRTTVQALQKSVSQREQQYIQILNGHLPSRLTNVLENNFFTSVALYLFFFTLALVTSIFSKAQSTELGSDAKQLVSQAKNAFQEEKTELNRHFSTLIEQTKAESQKRIDAVKQELEKDASAVQAQLAEAKKELVRVQDELLNRKAEYEQSLQSAKKTADDSFVQVSDLHYQIAEKDKRLHALESSEKHLEAELAKEREMHESSRAALHDAVQKLIELKKQTAGGGGAGAALGKTVA